MRRRITSRRDEAIARAQQARVDERDVGIRPGVAQALGLRDASELARDHADGCDGAHGVLGCPACLANEGAA